MIKLTHLLKEISQPKYLDLDLDDYHELPQRDGINVTHVAYMLTNLKNICKSIDSSLKPGGILVIGDYLQVIEQMLKYLPNYTILEFHLVYFDNKKINSAVIVLKK
jgi:hypothetical protein